MTPRSALTAALIAPVALAVLAGCGSQTAQPPAAKTTVTLSQNVPLPLAPGAKPPQILPAKTVTLAPGQSFAVRYQVSAAGTQWTQTVTGDSRILRQASATASACASGAVGCAESASTTYTARAAGTTTVRWSYIFRGICEHGPQPCPAAIQTINVIVQRLSPSSAPGSAAVRLLAAAAGPPFRRERDYPGLLPTLECR